MQQRRTRLAPRRAGVALLAALLAPLSACQPPDPDTPFDTYVALLGRALQEVGPAPTVIAAPPLPGGREPFIYTGPRTTAPDAGPDILDLSGCELQATIVRVRSALGRHAKPSQRLLLALDYLRLAPPCITLLRQQGREPLADNLQQGLLQRRDQLPTLIFDATLGSGEYRAFWQPVTAPGGYPRVGHEEAPAALAGINAQVRRWLDGDYRVANLEFELLLGEVAGGGGGTLLATLIRQVDWLTVGDHLLQELPAGNTPCAAKAQAEATIRHLRDARRFFELELRPRLATATHQTHALLTEIAKLEAMLATALPPHYRDWREQRDRHVQSLEDAPTRHLDALAQAIQSCTLTKNAPCPTRRKLATLPLPPIAFPEPPGRM